MVVRRARENVGKRGDARGDFGEADFQREAERNEEEHQQEQQWRQNDEPAARAPVWFSWSRLNGAFQAIVRDKLAA